MQTMRDGKVYEKVTSSFEWKVPVHNLDLFRLGLWGYTSKFVFCDASWDAHIACESECEMYLRLLKLSSLDTEQYVMLKWRMIAPAGTEFHSEEKPFEFCKNIRSSVRVLLNHSGLPEVIENDFLTISFTITCYRCATIENHLPKSEGDCTDETETQDQEKPTKKCTKAEEDCTKKTETQDQEKPTKRGTKDFEKLSRHFKDLLITGQDSDVTVKVNGSEFRVHKLILSVRSSVFDKMFRHDMLEKKEGVVDIRDCSPEAFKEFLFYLYSGELEEFSRKTVFDLYFLSDKYDVEELKSACVEFLEEDLCIDTFYDVVHLALQHKESDLLKKATEFFAENLKKIIVSLKWQSFIKENPIEANELYIKALCDVRPE